MKTYEYDSLMDDSPKVLQGVMKGEIQGAQKMLVHIVEIRFPSLMETAQQLVAQINSVEALNILAAQIVKAPDEQMAQWLLTTFTAS